MRMSGRCTCCGHMQALLSLGSKLLNTNQEEKPDVMQGGRLLGERPAHFIPL